MNNNKMNCHCDEIANLFATKTKEADLKLHLELWEALNQESNTSSDRISFIATNSKKEWLLIRNSENRIIGLATDNKWYNEIACVDEKLVFYRSTFRPGYKEMAKIDWYVGDKHTYNLVCRTNVKQWQFGEFDEWQFDSITSLTFSS